MRSDGQFTAITPERERLFVAARGRGLSVPDAAVEAGVSRASGYRLDRRVREVAAAAGATPPVPTPEDLAASEAEREKRETQRKAKAAERSRRARAKKSVPPKPERRQRAIPWFETREEFIARNRREREQARENPREHVFRASSIRAGSITSRGYDHQDREECERLARCLVEWGDSLLPEDVLVAALRSNDPYDFEQPLDLDAYAMKYAAAVASS